VRDTSSYLIDLGMVERIPGRFLFNYIPVRRPEVRSIRGGTSFWVTAGRAGVRSRVLTVPVTYPPEDVPAGELLSGLPLPDIRGTMGTFSYFATDLSRYEEGNTEFGGILKRLVFEAGVASTQLSGPPNPLVRQRISTLREAEPNDRTRAELAELHANADVLLPMRIEWRRGSKRAVIDLDGQRVALEQGAWSAWVNLEFRINALLRLQGMAQLYLIGPTMSCSSTCRRSTGSPTPAVADVGPERLSSDLYDKLGPFRTLGWAEATWPLEEGRIDEQAFMDDCTAHSTTAPRSSSTA